MAETGAGVVEVEREEETFSGCSFIVSWQSVCCLESVVRRTPPTPTTGRFPGQKCPSCGHPRCRPCRRRRPTRPLRAGCSRELLPACCVLQVQGRSQSGSCRLAAAESWPRGFLSLLPGGLPLPCPRWMPLELGGGGLAEPD
eukprot:1878233-Rhodomonas_salina.1